MKLCYRKSLHQPAPGSVMGHLQKGGNFTGWARGVFPCVPASICSSNVQSWSCTLQKNITDFTLKKLHLFCRSGRQHAGDNWPVTAHCHHWPPETLLRNRIPTHRLPLCPGNSAKLFLCFCIVSIAKVSACVSWTKAGRLKTEGHYRISQKGFTPKQFQPHYCPARSTLVHTCQYLIRIFTSVFTRILS